MRFYYYYVLIIFCVFNYLGCIWIFFFKEKKKKEPEDAEPRPTSWVVAIALFPCNQTTNTLSENIGVCKFWENNNNNVNFKHSEY